MWEPAELGEVIAERRLVFRPDKGRSRTVRVRLGRPVRSQKPEKGDPWWCPFEIIGLGARKIASAPGEDSVQALVLALRAVEIDLLSKAKRARGQIDWLGERERPVFAHTFFLEVYEAAIANLVDGLKLAHELIENPGGSRRFQQQSERLQRLIKSRGFSRSSAARGIGRKDRP